MNKFKIVFIILFCFVGTLVAQQKKYITYTVKSGETFKSIAKQYDLSKRDLMRLNPDLGKKLNGGETIVVPNLNFGKVIVKKEPLKRTHIVLPKENLFAISRKYGVSVDEIRAQNPQLGESLEIGDRLVIPAATRAIPADSLNYVLHTIVKDDTPFNVSRRYGVTEEELRALNPLLEDGFNIGMLLKIKPKEEEEVVEIVEAFSEEFDYDRDINVILMLPFQMQKLNDSLREETFAVQNSLLNIAIDFNLGAQMAIDSLRAKGLRIHLRKFDTENSAFKMQNIEFSTNFNSTDLVIGPLFYDKAEWLARRINAPVLAPVFSKKQLKGSSKNLIKTSPDNDVYETALLNYLENHYNGENVVLINDEMPENQSKLWRFVNKIKGFDSIQQVNVVKPEKGFINSEDFITKLDSMGQNWVIHLSDNTDTTSDAINNLKSPAERMHIQLFALSKGRNFEDIDNKFLGKLNFIFPTNEVIMDEESMGVRNFYSGYKARNFAVPSKYSLRGFDVTYDAIVRLATHRGDLIEGLTDGQSARLNSLFYYEKELFKTPQNIAVHLIRYNSDLEYEILREDSDEDTELSNR